MSKEVKHYEVDLADLMLIEGYTPYFRTTLPDDFSFDLTRRKSMQAHWDWAMVGKDREQSKPTHPCRRKRPIVIELEDCIIKLIPRE